MIRRHAAIALALAPVLAALAGADRAHAQTVVVTYDGASLGDFQTGVYDEDGARTAVDAGHFDVGADPVGPDGDLALNLDEQQLGSSRVRVWVLGHFFDAVSLEVVNPADSPGEYTISALGGSGSVQAPITAGTLQFGAGFQNIYGLAVTQNQPGAFSFDDVTLNVMPEPAGAGAWLAAAGLLAALRRRRTA